MGLFDKMKGAVGEAAAKVSATVQNTDFKGALASAKEVAATAVERTSDVAKTAYATTKEKAVSAYEVVSEEVQNFDHTQLKKGEFYQERFERYKDLGAQKVSAYFHSTFEVDKSTMDMVEDVRKRLPVPAKTVDDIFEQCKREAMRRAIATFALSSVIQDIDNRSAAKYDNLSESYTQFSDRSGHRMTADPNFAAMANEREDAQRQWTLLEDGYNKSQPLDPYSADVEHVIAKKDYYEDLLIRAGTTDDEFYSLVNASENLVFAESSFNRSLKEVNIYDYLEKRGRPDSVDPDLVHVDITQSDGKIKTVTVSKKDIAEAYEQADEKRGEHRLAAAKEVGMTAVKTGATMAAQQVVGLIVLETIDIFVDEIRDLAVKGRIINEDGWLKNVQDTTERIRQRLNERFEERQIWARAKSLGIEAGVAGAVSVIPQILISLILKMPTFVLAMIRECTMSIVRCVRVLSSDGVNKLESIQVILAGTASAIVGLYVSRAISSAMAGVPLLNRFNTQVTEVLTGLVVTAVPLTAIYAFEQNKQKLRFFAANLTGAA